MGIQANPEERYTTSSFTGLSSTFSKNSQLPMPTNFNIFGTNFHNGISMLIYLKQWRVRYLSLVYVDEDNVEQSNEQHENVDKAVLTDLLNDQKVGEEQLGDE